MGKATLILLGALVLHGALAAASAGADRARDPVALEVRDLHQDGRQSRRQELPILLMFSARYCDYCTRLREEYLKPMQISGAYADRVLLRELHIDGPGTIRDFANQEVSPAAFASRYRIGLTPSVLLLDGEGRELDKRLLGIGTEGLYGLYLDAAIERARHTLRRR